MSTITSPTVQRGKGMSFGKWSSRKPKLVQNVNVSSRSERLENRKCSQKGKRRLTKDAKGASGDGRVHLNVPS